MVKYLISSILVLYASVLYHSVAGQSVKSIKISYIGETNKAFPTIILGDSPDTTYMFTYSFQVPVPTLDSIQRLIVKQKYGYDFIQMPGPLEFEVTNKADSAYYYYFTDIKSAKDLFTFIVDLSRAQEKAAQIKLCVGQLCTRLGFSMDAD